MTENSKRIRVLVADDHPLFRDGVVNSLMAEPDIEIVGEASTTQETLQRAEELMPDLVILDISMPGGDGITAARAISKRFPVIRILILTASNNEDELMRAIKSGVRGFILKGVSSQTLVHVVRTVAAGGTYISPELAGHVLIEMTKPNQPDPYDDLTAREREILSLLALAKTNREIADSLHLSEKTIKHYVTNILQKLQVRSRVQAALLHQERKLSRGN